MKNPFAAALVLAAAAVALQWGNAQESRAETAPQNHAQAAVATPEAAMRVRMAFTANDFEPTAVRREVAAHVAEPTRPAAAAGSRPWYAMDQSLQRGDIVVRDGDALVYEGVRNGKRQFRTVSMSRLVSVEERDRIISSVRR